VSTVNAPASCDIVDNKTDTGVIIAGNAGQHEGKVEFQFLRQDVFSPFPPAKKGHNIMSWHAIQVEFSDVKEQGDVVSLLTNRPESSIDRKEAHKNISLLLG
jgi:hypothetical protein